MAFVVFFEIEKSVAEQPLARRDFFPALQGFASKIRALFAFRWPRCCFGSDHPFRAFSAQMVGAMHPFPAKQLGPQGNM
jgi:hypothetical protein